VALGAVCRGSESHFLVATATMGKFLASDDDESLCDGAQLAAEVAAGMLDSRWPSLGPGQSRMRHRVCDLTYPVVKL